MNHHESDNSQRSVEFLRFYQRNERKLYGYILSLVPNIAAADEIAQETNLRMWEQFDEFDRSKAFISWACTIAYYQILTYRKKSQREPVRFDSELLEVVGERAAARRDELAERQSQLIDCLSELDDFKRQAIRLYYSLGMTAKAVAEKLGRNVAAVEKTLVRTRRTLQDCIEKAMRREDHA